MGKGLERSLGRGPEARARIVTKRYQINTSMTVDGATGAGDGQLQIGDLAEGNLLLLGARSSLTFTGPTSGDLDDNWQGDYAIGSTADSGDNLTGMDANVIASTALAAATAEASPMTEAENTTTAFIDNTAGATGLFINLLVDDGNIGADGLTFTVVGEVHVAYIVMGDA